MSKILTAVVTKEKFSTCYPPKDGYIFQYGFDPFDEWRELFVAVEYDPGWQFFHLVRPGELFPRPSSEVMAREHLLEEVPADKVFAPEIVEEALDILRRGRVLEPLASGPAPVSIEFPIEPVGDRWKIGCSCCAYYQWLRDLRLALAVVCNILTVRERARLRMDKFLYKQGELFYDTCVSREELIEFIKTAPKESLEGLLDTVEFHMKCDNVCSPLQDYYEKIREEIRKRGEEKTEMVYWVIYQWAGEEAVVTDGWKRPNADHFIAGPFFSKEDAEKKAKEVNDATAEGWL